MKKTIGIVVARVQDELNKKYIDGINRQAQLRGYSVVVFSSIYSYQIESESVNEAAAKNIYNMIPYNSLEALIIFHATLFDDDMIDSIIDRAVGANVPVFMLRGIDYRCHSVVGEFENCYRELLIKVIKEHALVDTMYIGGRRPPDKDTMNRVAVYRQALKACGLDSDNIRLEYGEYWEYPAKKVIDHIFENGEKVPGGIFCANDSMAVAAIDRLQEYGIRVPEDVVVTGFDGSEGARVNNPSITTCCENVKDCCERLFRIIDDLDNLYSPGAKMVYGYEVMLAASTGDLEKGQTISSEYSYVSNRITEHDESYNNAWLDSICVSPSTDTIERELAREIKYGGAVAIRTDDFISHIMDDEDDFRTDYRLPNTLKMVVKDLDGQVKEENVRSAEIVKKMIEAIPDKRVGILTLITKQNSVFGMAMDALLDAYAYCDCANRFAYTLNRAFMVALNGEKQKQLVNQLSEVKYIDAVTGLRNRDGINKWFSAFNDNAKNHERILSVGVYSFMSYQKIAEQHGMDVVEDCLKYISRALSMANPDCEQVARISVDSFAVIKLYDSFEEMKEKTDEAVTMFYGFISVKRKNDSRAVDMMVHFGYSQSEFGWNNKFNHYVNDAISAMYINRKAYENHSPKLVDANDIESAVELQSKFMGLIKGNLFEYNFQPIVNAKNGDIVAYEALMRTKKEVGFNPLQVLEAAAMYRKENEIEWATFSNVLKRLKEESELFIGKKVFINSIAGHFLDENQREKLNDEYGEYISEIVVEITENDTIKIDELEAIRGLGKSNEVPIALDDYGTGHSNIVNLIEYKPQIVKIDRYLISGIDADHNKQMFVKNVIEFARENGISVLAEGVETRAELEKVVEFGVDLIQGYYTAKPSYEVLQKLPDDIISVIKNAQKS